MIIEHLPSYRTLQTQTMKTKELIGCAGKNSKHLPTKPRHKMLTKGSSQDWKEEYN